ncbi:MAG: fibronectin type III domain-containing protein [Phycisphaerales bacterium]|nr:fibronectin type III domain-containing protein [Phycisphaerales bacterium]MCI0676511.1 fibronectin type III domain-containing protein [Phycisphaerales bacterium]
MRRRILILGVLIVPVMALVVAAVAGGNGKALFSEARLIIEFNATDQDIGVQLFLDGEPWKKLKVFTPNGQKLLDIHTKGSFKELGLTELFFESHEPELADLTLEEFLALFPEGEYEIEGKLVDGHKIEGTAIVTHAIPDGPVLVSPQEGSVQDPGNTVVEWEPVADPPGSQIVEYQVIVERVDVSPKRVFSVHVPASINSVTVPPEFLESGIVYFFEVLAIEEGRNQTLSSSSFSTAP